MTGIRKGAALRGNQAVHSLGLRQEHCTVRVCGGKVTARTARCDDQLHGSSQIDLIDFSQVGVDIKFAPQRADSYGAAIGIGDHTGMEDDSVTAYVEAVNTAAARSGRNNKVERPSVWRDRDPVQNNKT